MQNAELHHYSASAFQGKDRFFGEIFLEEDALHFRFDSKTVSFPLEDLRIKAGGANDRMLFLTHSNARDWTVCTTDHSLLRDSIMLTYLHIAAQIAQIQQKKKQTSLVLAFILILCALSVYGLFALKEPLVTAIAKRIPPEWEKKLGEAAFTQIKAEKHFVDDQEMEQGLGKITGPLLGKTGQDRYSFRVYIAEDTDINAFALPGGIIVINSGLILAAESPEEIAGVLAHEAAHVIRQHGMRQLISSVGIFVLIQAFFGDATGLMAVLADNSAFLLTLKYSRDYEREADDAGWAYLKEARINPQGMIDFFRHLVQKQNKEDKNMPGIGEFPAFLSKHPATEERVDYLQKMWEKTDGNREYIRFDLDFSQFRQMVENKVRGR
ncbi:MAG: M48 family metallopeptidase [Desulfococcaceae bacterium]